MTAPTATNMFASAASVIELMGHKEALLSPENLHCDGEVSPAAARSRAARINADYSARMKELTAR